MWPSTPVEDEGSPARHQQPSPLKVLLETQERLYPDRVGKAEATVLCGGPFLVGPPLKGSFLHNRWRKPMSDLGEHKRSGVAVPVPEPAPAPRPEPATPQDCDLAVQEVG